MVLKVTVMKQSSKQLLPKFSSKAFFQTGVLKHFATEKHLCWSVFLIKLQAYMQATLWKREFDTGVFL